MTFKNTFMVASAVHVNDTVPKLAQSSERYSYILNPMMPHQHLAADSLDPQRRDGQAHHGPA
ncbi:hypothetical protein RRF57_012363 [Xylaria bambusicola]|uniref:Uncharacterized protein n=1 Tax=Xylaria bambusicola TaxID=326684 RepID=A0AAN7ZDK9_9PEZI